MTVARFIRFANAVLCGLGLPLVSSGGQSASPSQPAMIPTVVAQAMWLEPLPFGKPMYFDGRTPPDWPDALIPTGAKVVGGGTVGDSAMFRMRIAVFEFSGRGDHRAELQSLLARAGYRPPTVRPAPVTGGGFVESAPPPPAAAGRYCNGSTMAAFAAADSGPAPRLFTVDLIDGEAGQQGCSPHQENLASHQFPVHVPTLTPPAGTMSLGGGSSWGGAEGDVRSALRTTMPADSVLAHYTAQLLAAGWKSLGGPAIGDGVAAQRFSVRDGSDDWSVALVVTAAGDRRHLVLSFARVD